MKTGIGVIRGLLLLAASVAHAGLIGSQSLSSLYKTADLVVLGSASGTVQVGSPVADLSLSLTRVIKGDPALAGTVVTVQWSNGLAGLIQTNQPITVAGNGIWFLRHLQNGWSLLPAVQGAVPFDMTYFPAPASPVPIAYAYAETAQLQDKIASELGAAIESLNGNYNFQIYGLLSGELDQLKSPVIQTLYQRLSASSVVQQQILGLSGLIRSGNTGALATAAGSATRFSSYPIEDGNLLFSVRDQFRSPDATAIAALGQAAVGSTSPNLGFREASAHALAAIHSAPTLPYLATLLDDPDPVLRVEAIGGIGAFANGLPVQTPGGVAGLAFLQVPDSAPYKTSDTMANFAMGAAAIERNETSYLAFWKGWWLQNQASLGF